MSIRPVRTRWFEMLTSRDDLGLALEALAKTDHVELETHSDTHARLNLSGLQQQMDEYNRLARRYHPFWPPTDPGIPTMPGSPGDILDNALRHLQRWEKQAEPLVIRLETLTSEQDELEALGKMLQETEGETLDYALLTRVGPALTARLFALPAKTRIEQLPGSLLIKRTRTGTQDYLLAVGPPNEVDALAADLFLTAKRFNVHPQQARCFYHCNPFGNFASPSGWLKNYHRFVFIHLLDSFIPMRILNSRHWQNLIPQLS